MERRGIGHLVPILGGRRLAEVVPLVGGACPSGYCQVDMYDVQVSSNLSDILTPHTRGGPFRGWCRPVAVAPLASTTAAEKCAA